MRTRILAFKTFKVDYLHTKLYYPIFSFLVVASYVDSVIKCQLRWHWWAAGRVIQRHRRLITGDIYFLFSRILMKFQDLQLYAADI